MGVLQVVLAHLLANVTTAIFFGGLWANFVLWREYSTTLLWAFVISQALYSPKARLMRAITTFSNEDTRPMVVVLWGLISDPFKRMHTEGRPIHEMVFISTLNWCIEVFALVGLMSVTSRLSVWLLVVTALLSYGLVYALDRRVFAYRRVITDNTLACTVVIITFFASVSFIVLFLGLESILEGISAGQSVSTWVQSMVGGESSETEWGKNIARVTEFAQEQAGEFASQYNETDWFPVARDALSHYMEHGTLTANPETCADESCEAAETGVLGDFSGLVGAAIGHLSGLNVSMEHVVNYGGPSGKIIATGVALLASFGSYLILVGFKVVLFFTCVFYMTSHDDFLERNIGDFLPISQADRKRAMATLRGALQGVFFLPCKIACLHGVVTLLSFKVLQIEFPFFAASVVVLVSVLPIVPAYIVCWPWALMLVVRGRWVWGGLLAISQHLILSVIDTELCTQGVRDANPYLTSLSSFLGYSVFGAQGVLLGPLIMCLATLIYGGLGFLGNSMAQDGTRECSRPTREGAGGDTPQIQASYDTAGLCTGEELAESVVGANVSQDSGIGNHMGSRRLQRRVTLRLSRQPLGIKEESDEKGDAQESTHQTWRLKFCSTLTWQQFLHEVQDVMGVQGVSGIYGSDHARIERVDFVEDGEILDIVLDKPTG